MRDDYEDYDDDESVSRWVGHIVLKRVFLFWLVVS